MSAMVVSSTRKDAAGGVCGGCCPTRTADARVTMTRAWRMGADYAPIGSDTQSAIGTKSTIGTQSTIRESAICSLQSAMTALEQILSQYWGYTTFRPLQREAMEAILEGRDSVV